MNQHEGIQCDVCMKDRFEGGRYKCLRCHDYDLCADCYDANASSANHISSHPMQIVCSIRDMALYFGGEPIDGPGTISLTCSYCGEPGFEPTTLMTHLINLHSTEPDVSTPVLCPICVRRPYGNANYVTANLPGHFAIEHQVPAPRNLVSSLGALAVTALRNPPSASRPTLRSSSNSAYAQGNRNPMDAFLLELMSHLPEVRPSMRQRTDNLRESQQTQSQARLERQQARQQQRDFHRLAAHRGFGNEHLSPEEQVLLADGPPPTPPRTTSSRVSFGRSSSRASNAQSLEAVMFGPSMPRLHAGFGRGNTLTRSSATLNLDFAAAGGGGGGLHDHLSHDGAFVEPDSSADWVAVAGAVGGSCSSGGAGGSSSGCGFSLKSSRATKVAQGPKPDDRYLLKTLFNPTFNEDEKSHTDHERADRSLFVQALLLSAMSSDQSFEQTVDLEQCLSYTELKTTSEIEVKPAKKKNKRRRKGAKKHTTNGDENASQVSSQFSQEEL